MTKWWHDLKLNTKCAILILLLVLPVVSLFSLFLIADSQKKILQEKKDYVSYRLQENYDQIVRNVESIRMATDFFLKEDALMRYLMMAEAGGEQRADQMLRFYINDVGYLEQVVNNNPYLYQIRAFMTNDTMQEMVPIFYRREKMEKLAWGRQGEEALEGWHFNYADTLANSAVLDETPQIMSLVTKIQDADDNTIGILEVAMRMEVMFPGIYRESPSEHSCFVDKDGKVLVGPGELPLDQAQLAEILNRFAEEDPAAAGEADNASDSESAAAGESSAPGGAADVIEDSGAAGEADSASDSEDAAAGEADAGKIPGRIEQMRIGERAYLVGYQPVEELSGAWILLYDMQDYIDDARTTQIVYFAMLFILILALVVIISYVVKSLLKQLYSILHSIQQVQKGDLDVVIQNCGTDEMGVLGTQINRMLERIRQLMEDNLNRERLVKNSEIKALQNQINAHFIYNVLESVKMMAEIDGEYAISDAITSLGSMLRYSMRRISDHVTVKEELEYVRSYLALINLRFDYEIYLSENLPEMILWQEIPKMSLQPIVENAVYHGIEEMAEDTNIYIKGFAEGQDCIIEVTDAGRGMSPEVLEQVRRKIAGELEPEGGSSEGIGLKNVQDRIRMNYGAPYGLEIASMEGCYTKVRIRVPLTHIKVPELKETGVGGDIWTSRVYADAAATATQDMAIAEERQDAAAAATQGPAIAEERQNAAAAATQNMTKNKEGGGIKGQ